MSGLVVDVVFRDRVLETVPFDRPTLRVGRMPENDLVIDNLGVSRFHARLHLDDRRVFLEDDWAGHPLRKDYEDPYMLERPVWP